LWEPTYHTGEQTLAQTLWERLPDHSLTIVDKGFFNHAVFHHIVTQATLEPGSVPWLWRLRHQAERKQPRQPRISWIGERLVLDEKAAGHGLGVLAVRLHRARTSQIPLAIKPVPVGVVHDGTAHLRLCGAAVKRQRLDSPGRGVALPSLAYSGGEKRDLGKQRLELCRREEFNRRSSGQVPHGSAKSASGRTGLQPERHRLIRR